MREEHLQKMIDYFIRYPGGYDTVPEDYRQFLNEGIIKTAIRMLNAFIYRFPALVLQEIFDKFKLNPNLELFNLMNNEDVKQYLIELFIHHSDGSEPNEEVLDNDDFAEKLVSGALLK